MPLVQTNRLTPGELRPDTLQVYCGLDTMITFEVFEALQRLFNTEPITYNFERSLQGPILEIMLRGFLVDQYERRNAINSLKTQIARLDSILQRYAHAVWNKPLNPRSHQQLKSFFYTTMRLPEVLIAEKGQRKISFRREALEKLEVYFHAMPIIACIMAIRDTSKQLEILETEIDPDGRMRTSYNIAGTETGRLSSSSNAFGTGGNLQNIPPELRRVYIADTGWKLCVIDLEQAEARELGWQCGVLFGDWSYLDNCESGDLHTTNAKLIWKDLPWTGDKAKDRKIAEQIFYREFTYRDMSKRGGHGTNYYGKPFTIARHLKVPVKLIESFQQAYFQAYPAIPRFHQWVAMQIQRLQPLVTPFGRVRHFFGRPNDDSTLREAIAYMGQSPTADRTDTGLLNHWLYFGTSTQLLGQTHDSITFQYNPKHEAEIIPKALELMKIYHEHNGRRFTIPGEAKIGWNWGNYADQSDISRAIEQGKKPPILNLNGLRKYSPTKPDTRECLVGLNRVL